VNSLYVYHAFEIYRADTLGSHPLSTIYYPLSTNRFFDNKTPTHYASLQNINQNIPQPLD
jgi:hypothetical protein